MKPVQLILRPLSDLTKEIEHNGERFDPEFRIRDIYGEYYSISKAQLFDFNWENILNKLPFVIVKQLLEWHFDVFGLIEQGDAIDINSLNKTE